MDTVNSWLAARLRSGPQESRTARAGGRGLGERQPARRARSRPTISTASRSCSRCSACWPKRRGLKRIRTQRLMTRRVPVLIVGGGPVGLALAVELGWRGIACELIEQTDGAIVSPKMNEVNARSMEICRRWGIADQVFNCPFPADYPLDVAFVTEPVRLRAEPAAAAPAATARSRRRKARTACRPARRSGSIRSCSEFAASFPSVRLRHRCRLDAFEQTRRPASARRSPTLRAAQRERDRGRLSGRLRRRRQHGAPRARHRIGGAGDHRPSDQSVLSRAGPDRTLRQAAGHVLPRHRRDRAVGQPAHHRSGQRPVAADDRFHRRQRHARNGGSRILPAPRARPADSRSNGSTSTSGGAAARWRSATAAAASGLPATPSTSSRRPAAWA